MWCYAPHFYPAPASLQRVVQQKTSLRLAFPTIMLAETSPLTAFWRELRLPGTPERFLAVGRIGSR